MKCLTALLYLEIISALFIHPGLLTQIENTIGNRPVLLGQELFSSAQLVTDGESDVRDIAVGDLNGDGN